ncbi:hypothetical protein [Salinicoccus albus]|uniref:hypothetical protein n=1 Tax=Salinicoccus albus TaxID=418756 RepID=UPI00035DF72C|nr:hypothetical protein [Salinicoccus albus]
MTDEEREKKIKYIRMVINHDDFMELIDNAGVKLIYSVIVSTVHEVIEPNNERGR